jgi:putative ABC transport system permease protein
VTSASVSTGMPVVGTGFGMSFDIVGHEAADRSQRLNSRFNMVTPHYFQTLGINITRGRAFTEMDSAGGMRVAIVNSALVKKYMPNVDPLTQRVSVDELMPGVANLGAPVAWQIVGVYDDVRNGGSDSEDHPEITVPFAQSPWPGVQMAVRTVGDPANMSKSIAGVINSLDPDLPMADVKTMDTLLEEARGGDRFGVVLFGTFGVIALLLAAFGIYGVMSFGVAQRTHEIGLRMALGAGSPDVLGMILKEGMTLGAIGLLIGLAGAYGVAKLMRNLLYGIGTIDYPAFSAVAAILLFSAFLACYVPARRATRVDPMAALRGE